MPHSARNQHDESSNPASPTVPTICAANTTAATAGRGTTSRIPSRRMRTSATHSRRNVRRAGSDATDHASPIRDARRSASSPGGISMRCGPSSPKRARAGARTRAGTRPRRRRPTGTSCGGARVQPLRAIAPRRGPRRSSIGGGSARPARARRSGAAMSRAMRPRSARGAPRSASRGGSRAARGRAGGAAGPPSSPGSVPNTIRRTPRSARARRRGTRGGAARRAH